MKKLLVCLSLLTVILSACTSDKIIRVDLPDNTCQIAPCTAQPDNGDIWIFGEKITE